MEHLYQEPSLGSDHINQYLNSQPTNDKDAFNELIILLHHELTHIAHRQFARERQNHSLQTDDLVNKLYIKMLSSPRPQWKNRAHFLNSAARSMRQILIDHSRKWNCRIDGKGRVSLFDDDQEPIGMTQTGRLVSILTLESGFNKLERIDPTMAQIANLKIILGMTLVEIAEVMIMDLSKVKREWVLTKKILAKTFGAEE